MKKIILIFTLLKSLALADISPGTTALNFLNIPVDASCLGTGNAGCLSLYTPAAIAYNPGSLAGIRKMSLYLSHLELYANIRRDYIALAFPVQIGTIATSINFLYASRVKEFVSGVKTENSLVYSDFQVNAAYSLYVINNKKFSLSPGLNLFWVREAIQGSGDLVVGFNLGVKTAILLGPRPLWTADESISNKKWHNLLLGLSIYNVGTRMKSGSEKSPLPYKVAISADYNPAKWLRLCGEADFRIKNSPEFSMGAEFFPYFPVRLRAGIRGGRISGPIFTTGLGAEFNIGWTRLKVDYGVNPAGGFKPSHWFSFSFSDDTAKTHKDDEKRRKNRRDTVTTSPAYTNHLPANLQTIERIRWTIKEDKIEKNMISFGSMQVAILPFMDISESKSYNYLQNTIGDTLKDELSGLSNISIIESSYIDRIIRKLGVPRDYTWNKDAVFDLGKLLDVDVFIFGTFEELEDNLIINYQIYNGRDISLISKSQENAVIEGDLFEYIDNLSGKIFVDMKHYLEDN